MPPAPASPRVLDQARRAWLDGLRLEHRRSANAATALAVARGEWMCGDYPAALEHFIEAARMAREDLACQLALVRAASMLGRRELEDRTLASARQAHPASADLALHAALRELPARPAQARALLATHLDEPLPALFDRALAVLTGARDAQDAGATGDGALDARWSGFRWLRRHAAPEAIRGLPIDVLEAALAAAPGEGLTLECGVYFGRSLDLIAAASAGIVHGFDSFEGLPEAWSAHEPAGAYSTAGRLPAVAGNVRLHRGWFEHTLPPFLASHPGPVRLLHVDCDLYGSTRTVLEHVHHRLVPGSILAFDDFLGYPGYEQHELRAFYECIDGAGLRWEVVAGCLLGREVAFRITG